MSDFDERMKKLQADLAASSALANERLKPFTSELPPVSSVEVFRLKSYGAKNSESEIPVPPGAELYPNYRSEEIFAVTGKRPLVGAEALELADEWRRLEFDVLISALCHMPVYALKFSATDRVLLQITVCWRCSNFISERGDIGSGFNTSTDSAKVLRNHLEKLLPLED
jgi:hypothetical protein